MSRGAPGTTPRTYLARAHIWLWALGIESTPCQFHPLFADDFALIIDDFDHGGRPTPQKWPLNAPLPKVVWASKSVMCFGCSSWTNIACYLMQWRCLEGRRGHGFEWRRFLSHFLGQKISRDFEKRENNFCPKKWDKNGSTARELIEISLQFLLSD